MFKDYEPSDMGRPQGIPAKIIEVNSPEVKPAAKMKRLTIYKDGVVTYKWVLKENDDGE